MHATVHIFRYMRVYFFGGTLLKKFCYQENIPSAMAEKVKAGHTWGCYHLAFSIIASEYIIFALSLVSTYFFIGIITTNLFFRNDFPLGIIQWIHHYGSL